MSIALSWDPSILQGPAPGNLAQWALSFVLNRIDIGERHFAQSHYSHQLFASYHQAAGQADPEHWRVKKVFRSLRSWFKRGLRLLSRRLQTDQPLPAFYDVIRN